MKTTSFEISKKLAEIGFKADSDFSWNKQIICCGYSSKEHKFIKYKNGWREGEELFKSYDLETILEALPDKIDARSIDDWSINFIAFEVFLSLNNNGIGYYADSRDDNQSLFFIGSKKDQSLADTAARLLIKLYEKGIVKFGGKND